MLFQKDNMTSNVLSRTRNHKNVPNRSIPSNPNSSIIVMLINKDPVPVFINLSRNNMRIIQLDFCFQNTHKRNMIIRNKIFDLCLMRALIQAFNITRGKIHFNHFKIAGLPANQRFFLLVTKMNPSLSTIG